MFGVHVAVGDGAGYSIELGVEALSGLSEVMILANLMSRLTWPKKTAAKLQRLQGPCRVSLRAKLQDLLRLIKATSWGTQLAALLFHLQEKKGKREKQIKQKHTRFRKC